MRRFTLGALDLFSFPPSLPYLRRDEPSHNARARAPDGSYSGSAAACGLRTLRTRSKRPCTQLHPTQDSSIRGQKAQAQTMDWQYPGSRVVLPVNEECDGVFRSLNISGHQFFFLEVDRQNIPWDNDRAHFLLRPSRRLRQRELASTALSSDHI